VDLHFYNESIRLHGVGRTLYHAAYRALSQVIQVAVWNAIVVDLDTIDRAFLVDPRRRRGCLLEAGAMRPHTRDPENRLTDGFIDAAIGRGDLCYALFDGDALASYGWYARRPVPLAEIDRGLILHFDPAYVYMYHCFTHPRYRGQRLHAIGAAAALEAHAEAGSKGLVAYVDSSNFASLKSYHRIGCRTFGHVALLKVGREHVCRATLGCKKYDFRVEPAEG
jgi:hypothetical protein